MAQSGTSPLQSFFRRLTGNKSTSDIHLKDAIRKKPAHTGPILIHKTTIRPINRQSQDIQKWRKALRFAESIHDQRYLLYELYMDMLLDGFLLRQKEKRVEDITNSDLTFIVGGEPVPEVEDLQRKIFFHKFLREVIESKFWGHSLLELYWPALGEDVGGKTYLVNRLHVKPRLGIVGRERHDITGVAYREPPYDRVTIEVGEPDDLGLYLPVSQYVIYKRGNFGDWAEFAEIFGMPFRWATYNNEQSRVVLEEALEKAGAAGYVVAPEDANLQFFNPVAGSQSNDIYRFLRNACNEEISITILGNSMTTTEAAKSGYAQAEIHQDTQNEVHRADRRFLLRILNEKLTPYLEQLGYPVQGGVWQYEEEERMTLTQRLNLDMQVATKVVIPPAYWYEKYKLPIPETGAEAEKKTFSPSFGTPDL